MRKISILILVIFFFITCSAQKIEHIQRDNFIGYIFPKDYYVFMSIPNEKTRVDLYEDLKKLNVF